MPLRPEKKFDSFCDIGNAQSVAVLVLPAHFIFAFIQAAPVIPDVKADMVLAFFPYNTDKTLPVDFRKPVQDRVFDENLQKKLGHQISEQLAGDIIENNKLVAKTPFQNRRVFLGPCDILFQRYQRILVADGIQDHPRQMLDGLICFLRRIVEQLPADDVQRVEQEMRVELEV